MSTSQWIVVGYLLGIIGLWTWITLKSDDKDNDE